MISNFIPYGIYLDILNTLGRWKVLDIDGLSKLCGHEVKYKNLASKINKLEKANLIGSVFAERKKKYLFLSIEGSRFVKEGYAYDISNNSLNHDVVVTRFIRALLRFENFVSFEIATIPDDLGLEPDASVLASKRGQKYQLAIEIELTQKSQRRVKEKFSKYSRNGPSSYCLYVTSKRTLFEAYSRYLNEMDEAVREKVFLMHDEYLLKPDLELLEKNVFYKDKTEKFKDLFF